MRAPGGRDGTGTDFGTKSETTGLRLMWKLVQEFKARRQTEISARAGVTGRMLINSPSLSLCLSLPLPLLALRSAFCSRNSDMGRVGVAPPKSNRLPQMTLGCVYLWKICQIKAQTTDKTQRDGLSFTQRNSS